MNTAADLVERCVCETLTYYAFPDIHWQKIRTTDEIDERFFVNRATLRKSSQVAFFCLAMPASILPSRPPICGRRAQDGQAGRIRGHGLALTVPSTVAG